MNGGAAAAFLTFLSPLIKDESDATEFLAALGFFVYGLLFTVIAFGTIHLSLLSSGFNKPRASTTFYLVTLCLCTFAAILFLRGVFTALHAAAST